MWAISLLPFLKFCFFVHQLQTVDQLQTAKNTMFLVMENIFHSSLDATLILLSHKFKLSNLFEFYQTGNGRAIST
jgi:hypothetical protein